MAEVRVRAGKYISVVKKEKWLKLKDILQKKATEAGVRKKYKAKAHEMGLPQLYEMRWEEEQELRGIRSSLHSALVGKVKMPDLSREVLKLSRFTKTIADGTRYVFGVPCRAKLIFEDGHPYFTGEVEFDVGSYVVLVKPSYDAASDKTIVSYNPIYECCKIYTWDAFKAALERKGLINTAYQAVNKAGLMLKEFVEQGYIEQVAEGVVPEVVKAIEITVR